MNCAPTGSVGRVEDDLVAAVVPTRNNGDTIEPCLRSLLGQTYPTVVIVVDNHSDDGTREIAHRLGVTVTEFGPERSAQRNEGARLSPRVRWLLFVDSDMTLDPQVIGSCIELSRTHGAAAVVVQERSVGVGFLARCRALEKACYEGDGSVEALRFVDRDLFWRVGGFDEALNAGEDWDLHERVTQTGATIARLPVGITHHEGRVGLAESFKKKRYYGRSMPHYLAKHPERARTQLVPWRSAFLRNWRMLCRHPVLSFGLMVLKTVEASGLLVGAMGALREKQPLSVEPEGPMSDARKGRLSRTP